MIKIKYDQANIEAAYQTVSKKINNNAMSDPPKMFTISNVTNGNTTYRCNKIIIQIEINNGTLIKSNFHGTCKMNPQACDDPSVYKYIYKRVGDRVWIYIMCVVLVKSDIYSVAGNDMYVFRLKTFAYVGTLDRLLEQKNNYWLCDIMDAEMLDELMGWEDLDIEQVLKSSHIFFEAVCSDDYSYDDEPFYGCLYVPLDAMMPCGEANYEKIQWGLTTEYYGVRDELRDKYYGLRSERANVVVDNRVYYKRKPQCVML